MLTFDEVLFLPCGSKKQTKQFDVSTKDRVTRPLHGSCKRNPQRTVFYEIWVDPGLKPFKTMRIPAACASCSLNGYVCNNLLKWRQLVLRFRPVRSAGSSVQTGNQRAVIYHEEQYKMCPSQRLHCQTLSRERDSTRTDENMKTSFYRVLDVSPILTSTVTWRFAPALWWTLLFVSMAEENTATRTSCDEEGGCAEGTEGSE